MTIETQRQSFECDLYHKRDVCLVRGMGSQVWDDKGNVYLDCVSGHGVANLGHQHPHVMQAIRQQLDRLVSCSNVFFNDIRSSYLERLVKAAPEGLNRVFLCNSGTESIEAAMKFARLTTGRPGFISALRGFHGRTFGALSLTFNPKYREPFRPHLPDCSYVPFNKIDALQKELNPQTAAVVLEIVQGEGGVNIGNRTYLQEVKRLCNQNGTLLIIDEVQTGFGRTGSLFASQAMGIQPDMITLAKAMGGGLPMGGVLCADRVKVSQGLHGSTFGGNPLACAAGLAVLEVLEEDSLLDEVIRKGILFRDLLTAMDSTRVVDVRGLGLMIGVELRERAQSVLVELMQRGVLALPAGPKVLRFLPPLTISDGEIRKVVAVLKNILG